MKQLCLFVLIIICISSFTYAETEMRKQKRDSEALLNAFLNKSTGGKPVEPKMPKGPIFWEGWVKYFHKKSGGLNDKPTQFYINNDFFTQKVRVSDRAKKDKKGYVNIPTKFHFYSKFMESGVNVLSSRDKETLRSTDSLNIDLIVPIDAAKKYRSSIKDLGKLKEGHCISINSIVPTNPDLLFVVDSSSSAGEQDNWIVCLETAKEKDKLFTSLIQYKLLKQKKEKTREELKSEDKNTLSAMLQQPTPKIERYNGKGASVKDGYMILLNDWSQCTLKCGGGLQYQQWMCVPPKKGGKPCQGKPIRKRPCNSKPCPGTKTIGSELLGKEGAKNVNLVLKPIIKSMPFSTRPQQYVKCSIRENDVLFTEKNKVDNTLIQLPTRIVMNTRSIALFKDDTYSDTVFNFKLDVTELVSTKDPCCFKILSENKGHKICSFDTDCNVFVGEWQHSFSLFKTRCFTNLKKEDVSKSVGLIPIKPKNDDLLAASSGGSMDMTAETVDQRGKLIRKKLDEKNEMNFQKKLAKAEQSTLKAFKKELNIEELIKREERLKSQQETMELLTLMKAEKQKKEKLENIFKERETESVKQREKKEAKMQIERVHLDAKKEIEKKRAGLRTKIQDIRKKFSRRKKLIEQQINTIRGEMAKELINANKSGDMGKCKQAKESQEKIISYCNINIIDDFSKNMECKIPDSFCYICCETEFGNMFMEKRDKCYNMCDVLLKNELNSGEFKWNK